MKKLIHLLFIFGLFLFIAGVFLTVFVNTMVLTRCMSNNDPLPQFKPQAQVLNITSGVDLCGTYDPNVALLNTCNSMLVSGVILILIYFILVYYIAEKDRRKVMNFPPYETSNYKKIRVFLFSLGK